MEWVFGGRGRRRARGAPEARVHDAVVLRRAHGRRRPPGHRRGHCLHPGGVPAAGLEPAPGRGGAEGASAPPRGGES